MAVRKRLFTNESVEGTDDDFLKNKKDTPPVETSENNDTITPGVASISDINKKKKETKKPKAIKETNVKEKAEVKEAIEVTDEIENNSPIQLTLKTHNKDIKKYVTFFIRESTIALIAQYAGRGEGKDRTGYDKSEFVDLMLVKAINALKWNKEV